MASSILDQVLARLREAGFTAGVAYPGQDAPAITDIVAAAHIEQTDRDRLSVTLGVHILGPGSMGGTACELKALKASDVLRRAGGRCVQKACRYDGLSGTYCVEILAEFVGLAGESTWDPGPGFVAAINSTRLNHVKRLEAVQKQDYAPEYAMGEEQPVGYSRSREFWEIRLEELFPTGAEEEPEQAAPFMLKVFGQTDIEAYCNCRWTSVTREFTREGLRKIRRGISTERRST